MLIIAVIALAAIGGFVIGMRGGFKIGFSKGHKHATASVWEEIRRLEAEGIGE